jgi:hypothetical protein
VLEVRSCFRFTASLYSAFALVELIETWLWQIQYDSGEA